LHFVHLAALPFPKVSHNCIIKSSLLDFIALLFVTRFHDECDLSARETLGAKEGVGVLKEATRKGDCYSLVYDLRLGKGQEETFGRGLARLAQALNCSLEHFFDQFSYKSSERSRNFQIREPRKQEQGVPIKPNMNVPLPSPFLKTAIWNTKCALNLFKELKLKKAGLV